jgi:hypothetical protein
LQVLIANAVLHCPEKTGENEKRLGG